MSLVIERQLRQALESLRSGDPGRAEEICARILKKNPRHPRACHLLGALRMRRGDLNSARQLLRTAAELYRAAPSLAPADVEALYNLGAVFQEQGEFEQAAGCFRTVLETTPAHADALTELGIALQRLGRFDAAIGCFQQAIAAGPGNPEFRYNLGTAYREQGRLREAIRCFEQALEIQPDHDKALNNLGLSHYDELEWAASAAYLRRAAAVKPDNEWYHCNLGNTLRALNDFEGAIASYRAALELNRDSVEAINNLGVVFQEQGRFDDAVACFRRALAIEPDFAEAAMSLAAALLYAGQFEEGWKYYESRFNTVPPRATRRGLSSPRATEEDFRHGRRIALWGEQGLGDRIMYSSLVPELLESGAQLVLETDRRLLAAYRRSFPAVEFVAEEQPLAQALQRADANIPVASLAGLLRRRAGDFQRQPRGFLVPDSAKRDFYRNQLAARGGGLSVAISWKSTHGARGRLAQARKSAPMQVVAPLALVAGARLVDVQYGDTEAERAALAGQTGREIVRFRDVDHFNDLEDVLAIIAACDLVITTCNVTAHFAGAMGKPTWLLYPGAKAPFFYWIATPEARSLWYPSVEVITAPQSGDWAALFAHAARRLERYAC